LMQHHRVGDRNGAANPAISRETSPRLRVGEWREVGGLVYAVCPGCGRRIHQPFDPDGRPQVFVHHHGRHSNGRAVRLIVYPARRLIVEVEEATSLEDALRLALARAS
jgi:hypothetical protein